MDILCENHTLTPASAGIPILGLNMLMLGPPHLPHNKKHGHMLSLCRAKWCILLEVVPVSVA